MSRKDKILKVIINFSQTSNAPDVDALGLTASEIALKIGIDRSNVSRELNKLVREGLLIKLDGRPVKYIDKQTYMGEVKRESLKELDKSDKEADNHFFMDYNPFSELIGYDNSLKNQIKLAQSAILYPPRGLHTILFGDTGTGKTYFAQKMFQYALKMNVISSGATFVTFNCAEYSDNPQLLLSQLFGHVKGAYTGADREKRGLVEKANGGMLFLDEIHRLPDKGQEMLFTLMDQGRYRRLGETEEVRKSDVMIIGATSEDIDNVLLRTLLRRMPTHIKMPSLKERPIVERIKLIELFFKSEQDRIQIPLRVHKDIIRFLLFYDCGGNVGNLKSDIQLICARGLLDYRASEKQDYIYIDISLLHNSIEQIVKLKKYQNQDLYKFLESGQDIYDLRENGKNLSEMYEDYNNSKNDSFNYVSNSYTNVEECINDIMKHFDILRNTLDRESLLTIIEPKVYYAIEDAIHFAELKLDKKLSERAEMNILIYISSMLNSKPAINIEPQIVSKVLAENLREYKISKLMIKILEEEFGIQLFRQALAALVIFLCDREQRRYPKVGVVVLAHGDSTATSMAAVANKILNVNHCKGIDMSIDENIYDVEEKVIEVVNQVDEGKGVLFLVDMGSLERIFESISEKTGKKISSMSMVSTITVIEATRIGIWEDITLEGLVDRLQGALKGWFGFRESFEVKHNKRIILASCISGISTATRVRDTICNLMNITEDDNIKFITVDIFSKNNINKILNGDELKDVIAVVGTVDMELTGIPFIPVKELVIGEGIRILEKIIKGETPSNIKINEADQVLDKRILDLTLKEVLVFLDANKVSTLVIQTLTDICNKLNIKLNKELMARYVIHCSCMIERLIKQDTLPFEGIDERIKEYEKEFMTIKDSLRIVEESYSIEIPDTEIAYIIELFNTEITQSIYSVTH